MFSNLKNMIKKEKFSSVMFFLNEGVIKLKRKDDIYKVIFEVEEGFEEYEISEVKFFQYLENAMKKFSYSGKFRITNTVKMDCVCSFAIKRV